MENFIFCAVEFVKFGQKYHYKKNCWDISISSYVDEWVGAICSLLG